MQLRKHGLLAVAMLFGPALAIAADELALAQAKNCLDCHAVNQAVVGPSFKDIAAQYAGQPSMVDKLAHTIIHGGPTDQMDSMPANPQVSEAEARQLAAWILGLK